MVIDFWLVAGLFVAGSIVVALVRWLRHTRNVEALEVFATGRGWEYDERDNSILEHFRGAPFNQGRGGRARHVVDGDHRDRHLLAFQYSHTEGSGDDQSTVTYTVVALDTPASRPTLELSRERGSLGRSLLGLVGIHDLQLESEEFNRAFLIRTEDDKFAYDVLHPRMMEWMLADQRALELPFRFDQGNLITWKRGRIEQHELMRMLDYLCDLLDRVPAFVWKS